MTTTSEMTRDTVRAARTNSELLTARPPSWAAAFAAAVSDTARKYGLEHPGFDLGLSLRRDQQQDVAVVQSRVVLAQVGDRVGQLRVGDVVAPPPRDARVVEPDPGWVVADDRHEMWHRPARLLVVAVVARVVAVAQPVCADLGQQRPPRRELLRDHLRVVGKQPVRVAPVLLGHLTEHRVVQVRLRLPAVDGVDHRVGAVRVDDSCLRAVPVEPQHREVRRLTALLVLSPVVERRLGREGNLEEDVVREHGRRDYGSLANARDGLRAHRRDSRERLRQQPGVEVMTGCRPAGTAQKNGGHGGDGDSTPTHAWSAKTTPAAELNFHRLSLLPKKRGPECPYPV